MLPKGRPRTMIDGYALAQPAAYHLLPRRPESGGLATTAKRCRSRHSGGKQDFPDIEDGMVGECLGDFADNLLGHFLVQLLAQFAEHQRRCDQDDFLEVAAMRHTVEQIRYLVGKADLADLVPVGIVDGAAMHRWPVAVTTRPV